MECGCTAHGQRPKSGLTLEMAQSIIKDLNFVDLRLKLQRKRGWGEGDALTVEKWYRRFLLALVSNPTVVIVPESCIRHFWHEHILSTKRYERDCGLIFGEALEHVPKCAADPAALRGVLAFTNSLFKNMYSEDYSALPLLPEPMEQSAPSRETVQCSSDCRTST
jgi:hypothetical protein